MSNNLRVLFVDDEPNVLAAIRRMLRVKNDEWDMSFIESGAEALEAFKKGTYDVVVSDIRMPGMDGAELLGRIKDTSPGTIRIALSGQVDLNDVIRSIRAVHQYISKPCDVDKLVTKIEAAVQSRKILVDQTLVDLVAEIDSLPVIPRVFRDIEDELDKEEPSIDRVAALIAQDVGIVAKILKLVNSPFFGLPSNIDSVQKAVTMLGLDTIKALILSTHLFTLYDEKKLPNFSLTLLWEHCFRVSNIARLIARCEGLDEQTQTQCRMAGLLHDVGKLILASSFPEQYSQVLEVIAQENCTICEAEKNVFGTTHAEIGAYLMGLWGVAGGVVHGIGYHHEYQEADMSVAMLLSVADAIDHNFIVLHDGYTKIKLNEGLAPLARNHEKMLQWLHYLERHWLGVEGYYEVDETVIDNMI